MQGVSVLMAQAGMWLHCDPSMRPAGANEQVVPPLVCANSSKATSMVEAPTPPLHTAAHKEYVVQVPVFDVILADLGDSQSLQQSLSTFSGHMTQVNDIVQACGPGSLVLLDELGSGTDPSEGAALAIAVLRRLSYSVRSYFSHFCSVTASCVQACLLAIDELQC